MKRSIAAIVALSTVALAAHPNVARAASAPAATVLPNGMQGPNLSPAQQQKAIARKKKMAADVNALIQNKKLTNAQKQAKFVKLEAQFQADMLAILTPAQRADFLKRKANADARMKQIMDIRTKIINSLTPAQKQQIGALQANDSKTAQAVQNDPKLSQSEKNMRLQSLFKESQTKMEAILTPAQRAQFQKLQSIYPAPQIPPPPPAPGH